MLKQLGLGAFVAYAIALSNNVTACEASGVIPMRAEIADQPSLPCAVVSGVMHAFAPFAPVTQPEAVYGAGLSLFPDQSQPGAQSQPKPPSSNPAPPSLPDLFPPAQTRGNAQAQARLDKRTSMLKMHQRLGLITTIPLLATVISGSFAGGKHPSAANRDLHAGLGAATAGLYFSTAYFSIFAPRISGTKTRGPIRLHKALAWVHGPGMILTPILGVMAFDQLNKGEKVHGIAKAHGAVGYVTAAAYGAAIVSVSFKF